MATRPLTFGLRLRDAERDRTVRVSRGRKGFVVEETRSGITRTREHSSLVRAIKDTASAWRRRLH